MYLAPFELERWLARYEHDAAVNLGDSGVRPLPAGRFDTDPGRLGYVLPTAGDPDLRAAVGDRYDRSAAEVAFTCGTQEANLVTVLSLVSDGGHAVTVTPTYQSLHSLPDAVGEVSRVSLSRPDWTLSVDDVADAITPDTDLLVLNNPNNPTGRVHPESKVEALYDLAVDTDAYLLVDEVYRDLLDDPPAPATTLGERAISTCGLSKAWGLPGLRFGWLAGPEAVVSEACTWKDYTTIAPPALGQHVAGQLFADATGPDSETVLAENRTLADRNREILAAFVADHGLDWFESATVTGFVTLPAGFESGTAFAETLVEEAGVVVAPGDAFGHPGYVRIGFGVETDRLREGLDRIERFLDGRA
jgi:aspartate/methionine/tyrosine aminotransferase